jgi:DNA primase
MVVVKNSLEEIAKKLQLRKVKIRGAEIHASCPFPEKHLKGKDTHPSFSINIDKGVYNCFSCGSRGTIEELVSDVLGISVPAAFEVLQEWGFDKLNRELREKEVEHERPEILPEGLLLYYDKMEDEFAEIYRGEVDEQDCLIYPIRRMDGKLVGALARSIESRWHKAMWNIPKRLYLYGEDLVRSEEPIIIVEGPGDAISLRKSGIKNVVALMGVSVSDEQVEKLLSLSSSFIVWFDRDKAGATGTNLIWKKMDNRANMRYVDPWKHKEIKKKGDAKQVYEDFGPEKVQEIVSKAKTFLEHIVEDNCNGS